MGVRQDEFWGRPCMMRLVSAVLCGRKGGHCGKERWLRRTCHRGIRAHQDCQVHEVRDAHDTIVVGVAIPPTCRRLPKVGSQVNEISDRDLFIKVHIADLCQLDKDFTALEVRLSEERVPDGVVVDNGTYANNSSVAGANFPTLGRLDVTRLNKRADRQNVTGIHNQFIMSEVERGAVGDRERAQVQKSISAGDAYLRRSGKGEGGKAVRDSSEIN